MMFGFSVFAQLSSLIALSSTAYGLAVRSELTNRPIIDASVPVPDGVIVSPVQATLVNSSSVWLPSRLYGSGSVSETIESLSILYLLALDLLNEQGGIVSKSEVILDTGSADLWTFSSKTNASDEKLVQEFEAFGFGKWDPVADSVTTKLPIDNTIIQYADNSTASLAWWSGEIGPDDGSFKITGQRFGSAVYTSSFVGVAGIGPVKNEINNWGPHGELNKTYANIPVTLKEQGLIKKTSYSIYYGNPTLLQQITNKVPSVIIWGGVDHALYTGELWTLPSVTTRWPGLVLDSIVFDDGTTHGLNETFIFDTGTSTAAFPRAFIKQINDTFGVDNAGYPHNYNANGNQTFTFNFGPAVIDIPYSYFIQNSPGQPLSVYSLHASEDIGANIIGSILLKAFYNVFNYDDNTVGLSQATFNIGTHNITVIE